VVLLNIVDGSLSISHGSVAAGVNPAYAAFNPKSSTAYFTNENEKQGCIKAFSLVGAKLEPINEQVVSGNHPCFISVTHDGAALLCASYLSADLCVYNLASDGSLGPATMTMQLPKLDIAGPVAMRQDGPHAHCFVQLGDSDFGLCCDLGSDQVFCISIGGGQVVGKAALPEGSGPRHLAIASDCKWIYVCTELRNTICALPADPTTGIIGPPAAIGSLLPDGYDGPPTTASHIELSPCGRFAYVGNRIGVALDGACANAAEGAISVIDLGLGPEDGATPTLRLVELVYIGGRVPRGFCVHPAANSRTGGSGWLVVAAQESSLLKSFRIDRSTGRLSATGHLLEVPSPGVVVAGPRVL